MKMKYIEDIFYIVYVSDSIDDFLPDIDRYFS